MRRDIDGFFIISFEQQCQLDNNDTMKELHLFVNGVDTGLHIVEIDCCCPGAPDACGIESYEGFIFILTPHIHELDDDGVGGFQHRRLPSVSYRMVGELAPHLTLDEARELLPAIVPHWPLQLVDVKTVANKTLFICDGMRDMTHLTKFDIEWLNDARDNGVRFVSLQNIAFDSDAVYDAVYDLGIWMDEKK